MQRRSSDMRRRVFMNVLGGSAVGLLAGAKAMGAACADEKKGPPYKDVTLCGNCGQVKGSKLCCVKGAETCSKCGLAKGSPGCCRIKKGKPVTICGKCGQVKGSDVCCKPGAKKCKGCGLDKGSPGCCRINKI